MAKYSSQTSVIKVHDGGSPGTYITIGNATNVRDLRSGTAAEEDVSDLSSVAVETMLHLPDNGSFSFDLIFDPADTGQARLATLQRTVPLALGLFKIEFTPADYMYTLSAYVSTFPFTLQTAAAARGSVTCRISGAITEATPIA
jgi:hypothetical protein